MRWRPSWVHCARPALRAARGPADAVSLNGCPCP
jgi:hypothetical protein